ncbi:uncharacterized protein FIBRA_00839 [Fibroporia radiculosa]|uniref:3beta-hydroxysteroid 3-dehydrogenase n=1 Tax=Fibroporia radiculosa TaxID=599839 RepID=J4H0S0_9APHY|nr:uncharacterized protein FIBRA_00839 [Fibroporia radiculosa]CCL98834.1 predicted protein [Fibroporia radiculosa]
MARASKNSARLVIIVTGANAGVGFGLCHRLLVQLSQVNPPDSRPQLAQSTPYSKVNGHVFANSPSPPGLTLILACRDKTRAENARAALYGLLDTHIAQIPRPSEANAYASEFRRNLLLQIHRVDLGNTQSILQFGREISEKYPYISHLICNAGVSTYSHINYIIFARQCFESLLKAVLHPTYNVQKVGVISGDNLGFVWQCNVFGHYVMFRQLQPLLAKYKIVSECSSPARILWMSSVDALPLYDPTDDWQLTKTNTSYQASKSQIDLMTMALAQSRKVECNEHEATIEHLLVTPGITPTNIAAELLQSYILELFRLLFFYICRLIGSPHILFSTYKAAVAASHAVLAPLSCLPHFVHDEGAVAFPKFSAQTDRWGNESVGIVPVHQWQEHPDEGSHLIEQCERLYQTFLKAEIREHRES